MGKMSRDKGKRGELELSKILTAEGYPCRRGQQTNGALGEADVEGLPGIHIECKRVERLDLDAAMKQSVDDAYAEGLKWGHEMLPAVFHRANASPSKPTRGSWKVTMLLKDWIRIFREYDSSLKLKEMEKKK